METDSRYFILIAAVIGVVGIAIGTLLSEFRTLLENRRANKRILKTALYHQYELFGEMLAFDRDLASRFVDALKKGLINIGAPEAVTSEVFGSIPIELYASLQVVKAEGLNESVEKHEAIMLRLSEVDPFFAANWSYRSRSRFPEQMQTLLDHVSSLETEKTETTDKFVAHIRNWFDEKSQKRLLEAIEKGIKEIAWRISFRTWWKVTSDLKKWRTRVHADIEEETKEYILQIVKFVMTNQEAIQKETAALVKAASDGKG